MIRLLLSGCRGRMGRALYELIQTGTGVTVVAGVDPFPGGEMPFPVYLAIAEVKEKADVIVDFSRPDGLPQLLGYTVKNKVPLVLATTGHSSEQKKLIAAAAVEIPLFQSGNMSLGVNLMLDLLKTSTRILGDRYDIEVVEKHHNQKLDAPSGTALMMADAINEAAGGELEYTFDRHNVSRPRGKRELGIHSIRAGNIVGEHTVIFAGQDEFFEITHKAQSRQIFALGALRAAEFIPGKTPGLYTMADLISRERTVTRAAREDHQAMLTVASGSQGTLAFICSRLAEAHINVDMISQTGGIHAGISLSLSELDADKALQTLAGQPVSLTGGAVKLAVEGMGMETQPGAAARFFTALANKSIPLWLVTTSETKIAVLVQKEQAEQALQVLKSEFGI